MDTHEDSKGVTGAEVICASEPFVHENIPVEVGDTGQAADPAPQIPQDGEDLSVSDDDVYTDSSEEGYPDPAVGAAAGLLTLQQQYPHPHSPVSRGSRLTVEYEDTGSEESMDEDSDSPEEVNPHRPESADTVSVISSSELRTKNCTANISDSETESRSEDIEEEEDQVRIPVSVSGSEREREEEEDYIAYLNRQCLALQAMSYRQDNASGPLLLGDPMLPRLSWTLSDSNTLLGEMIFDREDCLGGLYPGMKLSYERLQEVPTGKGRLPALFSHDEWVVPSISTYDSHQLVDYADSPEHSTHSTSAEVPVLPAPGTEQGANATLPILRDQETSGPTEIPAPTYDAAGVGEVARPCDPEKAVGPRGLPEENIELNSPGEKSSPSTGWSDASGSRLRSGCSSWTSGMVSSEDATPPQSQRHSSLKSPSLRAVSPRWNLRSPDLENPTSGSASPGGRSCPTSGTDSLAVTKSSPDYEDDHSSAPAQNNQCTEIMEDIDYGAVVECRTTVDEGTILPELSDADVSSVLSTSSEFEDDFDARVRLEAAVLDHSYVPSRDRVSDESDCVTSIKQEDGIAPSVEDSDPQLLILLAEWPELEVRFCEPPPPQSTRVLEMLKPDQPLLPSHELEQISPKLETVEDLKQLPQKCESQQLQESTGKFSEIEESPNLQVDGPDHLLHTLIKNESEQLPEPETVEIQKPEKQPDGMNLMLDSDQLPRVGPLDVQQLQQVIETLPLEEQPQLIPKLPTHVPEQLSLAQSVLDSGHEPLKQMQESGEDKVQEIDLSLQPPGGQVIGILPSVEGGESLHCTSPMEQESESSVSFSYSDHSDRTLNLILPDSAKQEHMVARDEPAENEIDDVAAQSSLSGKNRQDFDADSWTPQTELLRGARQSSGQPSGYENLEQSSQHNNREPPDGSRSPPASPAIKLTQADGDLLKICLTQGDMLWNDSLLDIFGSSEDADTSPLSLERPSSPADFFDGKPNCGASSSPFPLSGVVRGVEQSTSSPPSVHEEDNEQTSEGTSLGSASSSSARAVSRSASAPISPVKEPGSGSGDVFENPPAAEEEEEPLQMQTTDSTIPPSGRVAMATSSGGSEGCTSASTRSQVTSGSEDPAPAQVLSVDRCPGDPEPDVCIRASIAVQTDPPSPPTLSVSPVLRFTPRRKPASHASASNKSFHSDLEALQLTQTTAWSRRRWEQNAGPSAGAGEGDSPPGDADRDSDTGKRKRDSWDDWYREYKTMVDSGKRRRLAELTAHDAVDVNKENIPVQIHPTTASTLVAVRGDQQVPQQVPVEREPRQDVELSVPAMPSRRCPLFRWPGDGHPKDTSPCVEWREGQFRMQAQDDTKAQEPQAQADVSEAAGQAAGQAPGTDEAPSSPVLRVRRPVLRVGLSRRAQPPRLHRKPLRD